MTRLQISGNCVALVAARVEIRSHDLRQAFSVSYVIAIFLPQARLFWLAQVRDLWRKFAT